MGEVALRAFVERLRGVVNLLHEACFHNGLEAHGEGLLGAQGGPGRLGRGVGQAQRDVGEGDVSMKEETIEVAESKRLIVRYYEEDGLLALIVQRRHPLAGQEDWTTREHVTLRPERAKKLKEAIEKFTAKGFCPNCNAPLVVLEKPAEMTPSPSLLDLVPESLHGEIPVFLIREICPKCGFTIGVEMELSTWQVMKERGEL